MGRIDDGINRLARLVDDMLDISRITTGKLVISPAQVELTALARDVTERMRSQFDLSNVKLELIADEPAQGPWDPLRIQQVLWNLLSNALRYGRGSPVYVRAGLHRGRAGLEAEDEGPGIAPENQVRIFDKFERADIQKEAFGLGLGLHICKSIVELHGGQIELHSEDAGTVFSVTLPVQDSGARRPRQGQGRVAAPLFAGVHGEALDRRQVNRIFGKLAEKASKHQKEPIALHRHRLRHTFGDRHRAKSGSDAETAAALGHTSSGYVGRYIRKTDEERHGLVEKLLK